MSSKYFQGQEQAAANHKPCFYCSRPMRPNCPETFATRDHTHPRSKGGRATVWACFTCNNLKGSMTLFQWFDFMKANPEWWEIPRRRAALRAQRRAEALANFRRKEVTRRRMTAAETAQWLRECGEKSKQMPG